jgi:hypothetical protein
MERGKNRENKEEREKRKRRISSPERGTTIHRRPC